MLLQAFRNVLEGDALTVVGCAATAAEALRLSEGLRPDVVLLDVGLADASAVDVARALVDRAPGEPPKVILISAYGEEDFGDLVPDTPAVGFIAKSELSAARVVELLGPS